MDFSDFKTYFSEYVQGYAPYKNSRVFQVFTSFLMDKYFDDSYVVIPSDMKQAYESQSLPTNFVVPFLESVGLTVDIISKLSAVDRYKIATLMADFHRYKGTVLLVDKLLINLAENDSVAVYELYLDRQTIGVWNVLPKLIGKSALVSTTKTKSLPYTTLDSATHWYIDVETLETMYSDTEMILPYKTNCLLVDGNIQEDLTLIVGLVSALTQESFKADVMQLFFNDGTYSTTFSTFYSLWFYVLEVVANKGTNVSPFITHEAFILSDVFNTYEVPTTAGLTPRGKTNIQSVLDQYFGYVRNTNTDTISQDIWTLFKNKISIFNNPIVSATQTFDQHRATLRTTIGNTLIDYIDNRLSTAVDIKIEANTILGELYNSMLTFKLVTTSTLNTEYIDYMLLTLPGYTKDISTSPFYIMLDFLKPMHCDLISNISKNVSSRSLFDNGLVSYITAYSFMMNAVTHAAVSDSSSTLQTTLPLYNNAMAMAAATATSSSLSKNNTVVSNITSGPYTYVNPNGGGIGIPTTIVYTT